MMRPMDLGRVKEEASFEQILQHYGVKLLGSGRQRMALCPFHRDTRPSCSVNLERKVFHCFGCGARGSVLDFVALMERIPIREAAAIVVESCRIRVDDASSRQLRRGLPKKPDHVAAEPDRTMIPVPPKLDLDPTHPYLAKRNVGPELAATFGLGYCARGAMKGRICIPIHNERGALVAYAGRWASDEVPKDVLRYKLPRGFEKQRVLFNLHRVAGARHLVIVEGYWSVFRLQTLRVPAIALMGRSLSDEQEALLLHSNARMLTLLLDGDAPGRKAAEQLLPRLARQFFIRVIDLPEGGEPDTIPEKDLVEVLCTNRS